MQAKKKQRKSATSINNSIVARVGKARFQQHPRQATRATGVYWYIKKKRKITTPL